MFSAKIPNVNQTNFFIHGAPFKSLQKILSFYEASEVLSLFFSSFSIKVGPLQVTQNRIDPLRLFMTSKEVNFNECQIHNKSSYPQPLERL